MFYFHWKIPIGGLKPRRFQYQLTRSIIARNAWWTVHFAVMWIWLTPMKVLTEVHMDIGSPRMLTSKVMFLIFFKVFWVHVVPFVFLYHLQVLHHLKQRGDLRSLGVILSIQIHQMKIQVPRNRLLRKLLLVKQAAHPPPCSTTSNI